MKNKPITYLSLQTFSPTDWRPFISVNVHRDDNAKSYMNPTPSSVRRVIRAQAKRALIAFKAQS